MQDKTDLYDLIVAELANEADSSDIFTGFVATATGVRATLPILAQIFHGDSQAHRIGITPDFRWVS